MQKWLARFSFSFLIVGFYLGFEAYRAVKGQAGWVPQWRIVLYLVAAAASISLGISGIRARHRQKD